VATEILKVLTDIDNADYRIFFLNKDFKFFGLNKDFWMGISSIGHSLGGWGHGEKD
jgi:hypothetical protein